MLFLASRRCALLAGAACLFSWIPSAGAAGTTTINLHTANGTCIATTAAADGVKLDDSPNATGTALAADGVSLTESPANSHACLPVGGSTSDFQANVVVSGNAAGTDTGFTPAVGTPFYVIWSAQPSSATKCVRTLTTSVSNGLTGWVAGSVASVSASGKTVDTVTANQGGNYTFGVVCSNDSGVKTASPLSVPAPPISGPTPNPFKLTVSPTTVPMGSPVTVSTPALTNATSCVGKVFKAGVEVTSGWTDWRTTMVPNAGGIVSKTFNIPTGLTAGDTYTFRLTCSRTGSAQTAVDDNTATMTVAAQVVDNCPSAPMTRLVNTTLCYNSPSQSCTSDAGVPNLTTFSAWLGRSLTAMTLPGLDLPGANGAGPAFVLPNTQYVAATFMVPAAMVDNKTGTIQKSSGAISNSANYVTMSISTKCGDFDSSHFTDNVSDPNRVMPAACFNPTAYTDEVALKWIATGTSAGRCPLTKGVQYYLNVKTSPCGQTGGVNCKIRIDSNG